MKKWYHIEFNNIEEREIADTFKRFLSIHKFTFNSSECFMNNLVSVYCTEKEAKFLNEKLDIIRELVNLLRS